MTARRLRTTYIAADYFTTLLAVVLFDTLRYWLVPDVRLEMPTWWRFMCAPGVVNTLLFFPPFMLLIYYLSGYYVSVSAKSRVTELLQTIAAIAAGSLVFFLVILLNDVLPRRRWNYEIILLLAASLFAVVYPVRLFLTLYFKRKAKRNFKPTPTMIICERSLTPEETKHYNRLYATRGLHPAATIHISAPDTEALDAIPAEAARLGIRSIVLIPGSDRDNTLTLFGRLLPLNMPIYVTPDDRALVMGMMRFDSLASEPLVDISRIPQPDSVVAVKRFLDIVVSASALTLTLPLTAALALTVRLRCGAPVFFRQERVGYHGRPFTLYKFRTMVVDSEPDGPRLSTDNDPRITGPGRIMRRYRLDELPNFYNVLRGDMSLVGPRPERQYFVDRIMERAPHYALLQQVRPGLTSWGMVKFGYASTVDEMLRRMTYDILYIQNLSLAVDLRILIHTFSYVLSGEGK